MLEDVLLVQLANFNRIGAKVVAERAVLVLIRLEVLLPVLLVHQVSTKEEAELADATRVEQEA